MRKVDRTAGPPAVLSKKKPSGLTETEEATAFYKQKANRTKPFPFEVYSHDDVKDVLENLFHKKCAYCESFYVATQPMDVEHWRPKGAVEIARGKKKKPGYYWLAASWDNLLPSCTDCNRRRYQREPGSDEEILLGKEGQFPLADESKRAEKPGEEALEEPLLIHPCAEDPAQHLVFDETEENKAVCWPRKDPANGDSPKGAASIRVYALNRSDLVQARRQLFLDIELKIATIRELMDALEDARTEEKRQKREAAIRRQIEDLTRLKDPRSPYSALAKQMIEKHRDLLTR